MKRILIPISGIHTPLNALSFAGQILNGRQIPVYGIFLKEAITNNDGYPFPNDMSLASNTSREEDDAENSRMMEDNIKLFRDECEAADIEYQVETGLFINQFIDEISATDLIITDTRADFLEKLLPHIRCPACLISDGEMPRQVVLLHDGSDSAKHAITTYTSFLPEWSPLPTVLLSINAGDKKFNQIEADANSDLKPVFSNLSIQSLEGKKEKELISFLEQLGNSVIVVMGAFGRTAASMFFHESLSGVIIDKTRCSLFVAHL